MYTVTLTANDGFAPPVSDSTTVTVANVHPTWRSPRPQTARSSSRDLGQPVLDLHRPRSERHALVLGELGRRSRDDAHTEWRLARVAAFVAPGATITVSVTDDDGGTGSAMPFSLPTSRWHPRTRSMSSAPRVRRTRSQRRSAPGQGAFGRARGLPGPPAARTPARLARTRRREDHLHTRPRRDSPVSAPTCRGCFTTARKRRLRPGDEGMARHDPAGRALHADDESRRQAYRAAQLSGQNPDGYRRHGRRRGRPRPGRLPRG